MKSLFTGHLRIVLVFAILTIAPLILESLQVNTPVNGDSPKLSGHLFTFTYLILMFVVSHINLTYIHVSTYPKKWYLMWFILSVVFERTVSFVATVDFVLKEYSSCLPNNK